ncbi:MAG: sulfatase [Myxococcales bacterium]|nr:sulfatase [Myxococcales bacterium]
MNVWLRRAAGWLAAIGLVGCGDPPTSIVLVTVDTLRADHLGSYGYFRDTSPHLDRLASESLLFENAYATSSNTLPSHVSILTSTYPARHGVEGNFRFYKHPLATDDSLQSMAQRLRAAGFDTAAFTSASALAEPSGVAAGFASFYGTPPYDSVKQRTEFRAEQTVSAALEWLSTAAAPFFLWLHVFDPHLPYAAPAPYQDFFATSPELHAFMRERRIPRHLAGAANAYDDEIRYADAQLGRLFERLRELGPVAIVVTADHGEGLGQHRHEKHSEIWNEQLRVPLIVHLPNGYRGRRTDLASTVDIFPTLSGALNLHLDFGSSDGIDLLAGSRSHLVSQTPVSIEQPRADYAIVGSSIDDTVLRHWKLRTRKDGRHQLFDVAADPHELSNLASARPATRSELKRNLDDILSASRSHPRLAPRELTPEEREAIRALGYAE